MWRHVQPSLSARAPKRENRKGNSCHFISDILNLYFFFKSVKTRYFFSIYDWKKKRKDICFRIEGRKIDPDWVGKTSTENTVEQQIQMFMSRTRGRHRKKNAKTEWSNLTFGSSFDLSVVLLFCCSTDLCLNFHGFLSRRGSQKLG